MLHSSFRPQNHDFKMLLQETCTSLKTLTKRSAVHGVAADVSTKEGREAAIPIPVQGLESSALPAQLGVYREDPCAARFVNTWGGIIQVLACSQGWG